MKDFTISVPFVSKNYNKIALTVKRGRTTQKTFEISGKAILGPDRTECYFGEAFNTISAFDVNKKTGGWSKKIVNITVIAFDGEEGSVDKDVIGTIDLECS